MHTSHPCSSTAVMFWLGKWELTGQREHWRWERTPRGLCPARRHPVGLYPGLSSQDQWIATKSAKVSFLCTPLEERRGSLPAVGLGRRKNIEVFWGRTGLCQHMGQPQLCRLGGTGTEGLGRRWLCRWLCRGRRPEGSVPEVVGAWLDAHRCVCPPPPALPRQHIRASIRLRDTGSPTQPPPPAPFPSLLLFHLPLSPPGVQATHPRVLPAPSTLLPRPLLLLVFSPALAPQSPPGAQAFGPEALPTTRTGMHGGTVLSASDAWAP